MQPPAAILTLDRETRLASIGCMFQYISNNFHDFQVYDKTQDLCMHV